MAKYIIEGGNKLKGKVLITGNKNSVLPCMAAALLTEGEVVLKNVPDIADVDAMLLIFEQLGVTVSKDGSELRIKATEIKSDSLPEGLTGKLRASILLIGPLLSKKKNVKFSHPGGDVIGQRSIDIHLKGLKELGYEYQIIDRAYEISKKSNFIDEKTVFLEDPSVTGTENLVMASVLGSHKITLKNCAQEPHVIDLCKLLNLMGAKIEGAGTSTLKITGVEQLNGAVFEIGPDYIEMATYVAAACMTSGGIEIENCSLFELEPITSAFKKMGINLLSKGTSTLVQSEKILPVPQFPGIVSRPWPGFPTDLMSIFIVMATQAQGMTLLHDWMYESRMFFVDKLISMGANITIADPHRVLVYGPAQLWGRNLETPDIRAGMAMVLAALIAQGKSTINKAELIERGYADVVNKLRKLGAKIERVD